MAIEPPARAFERSVNALLAQLESPSSTATALRLAAERCAAAFGTLTSVPSASLSDAERDCLERARHALSVASDLALREIRDVERRLQLARAARRALATHASPGGGAACDVAG